MALWQVSECVKCTTTTRRHRTRPNGVCQPASYMTSPTTFRRRHVRGPPVEVVFVLSLLASGDVQAA